MKRRLLKVGLATFAFASTSTLVSYSYVRYASWAFSPVTYYINPQNSDVSADAAEAALQWAASAWSTQSRAAFRFMYGGRVGDTSTGYDGRNVVIFRNASSGGAIASTYSWWDASGHLVDSDIIIWDANFRFFTGSSGCVEAGIVNSAYLEDVITHEFGHMLGLQHSSVPTATMYPSYGWCSQEMRSLDPDDIAGVEAIYPSGGAARLANTPPAVAISSPAGVSVAEGTSLLFAATASDAEDGNLTGNVTWTSSLDGRLGTGSGFTRALSAGTHTITASVTDSGGLAGSASVTLTVVSLCVRTSPTVTTTSSGNSYGVAGFAQTYTVRVTNNDSASCGASTFALQPTVPSGWGVSITGSLSVSPGATASTSMKLTPPAGTYDGGYGVWLTASNVTSPGYGGVTSFMDWVVSTLGVSVSPGAWGYTISQTGAITVWVTQGADWSAAAKLTIVMTRPDGTVFKRWTPKTSTAGSATVTFKASAPAGTYTITVTATKGQASGIASTQVYVY